MSGKRSIFEEVSDSAAATAAAPAAVGAIDRGAMRGRLAARIWLGILFALVVVMIAVGGATRLTDSGLSITEWRPVTGALPPLSAADWQAEFDRYREIPQYQLVNRGMSLEEFQFIYWWEWGHRQLGRLIGLVWALGLGWLWLTRRIPAGWGRRFVVLGALGGLQGAIGWWMVASGLGGTMVSVASYRLAVHLGLAFVILGLIAWHILGLGRTEVQRLQARRAREGALARPATGLMHLAFVQILLGALVAGIDAGRAFPTWPSMNGEFFPANAFYVPDGAAWRAFFENPGLVQFIHRMTGYALALMGVWLWWRARGSAHRATRRAFDAVAVAMAAQIALGIWAVLSAAALPVALGHQFGAVVLWVAILRARHHALYPRAGSIREGTA
jgi:cytochrome c oxidase assembly protein subunit 15